MRPSRSSPPSPSWKEPGGAVPPGRRLQWQEQSASRRQRLPRRHDCPGRRRPERRPRRDPPPRRARGRISRATSGRARSERQPTPRPGRGSGVAENRHTDDHREKAEHSHPEREGIVQPRHGDAIIPAGTATINSSRDIRLNASARQSCPRAVLCMQERIGSSDRDDRKGARGMPRSALLVISPLGRVSRRRSLRGAPYLSPAIGRACPIASGSAHRASTGRGPPPAGRRP